MEEHRFEFAFTPAYRLPGMVLGITPWTSHVRLGPSGLRVRFGPWSLATPLDNVRGAAVTGDFSWHRTAGPPRLSLSDKGVTFATNGSRAVCVQFREPVAVLDPTGRVLRHPGATLTVADVDGLHERLQGLSSPSGPG